MKIKLDFVTNSSSTCFVVIINKGTQLNKEDFMSSVGINKKSPAYGIFEKLFTMINSNMRGFDSRVAKHRWNKTGQWDKFIEDIFSSDLVKRITEAKAVGAPVYFGELSSDVTDTESFFCCDSFKIEGNSFYIDASNSSW
jgi:hypothetical protein